MAEAEAAHGEAVEDPEPELEEGEVEETEEEQLNALKMLSELLKEKAMLGRQLDERLAQQKADSASLGARMDAMENDADATMNASTQRPSTGDSEDRASAEESAAEME